MEKQKNGKPTVESSIIHPKLQTVVSKVHASRQLFGDSFVQTHLVTDMGKIGLLCIQ
jgi:hypothetical protein